MRALTIWKKEAWSYATMARWYVMGAIFFGMSAVAFAVVNLFATRDANVGQVTGFMGFLLMTLTPIFTMRLVAEEANRGTLEMLLTSPVRDWEIVAGKYLGALTALVAMFATTLIFPLILTGYGEPDWGMTAAQYLGLTLQASAFIAIGLFFSSVTNSQALAAGACFVVLVLLWIFESVISVVPSISFLAPHLSLFSHAHRFQKGVIDALDVFYYLAFTAIFLVLALRSIDARRWA